MEPTTIITEKVEDKIIMAIGLNALSENEICKKIKVKSCKQFIESLIDYNICDDLLAEEYEMFVRGEDWENASVKCHTNYVGKYALSKTGRIALEQLIEQKSRDKKDNLRFYVPLIISIIALIRPEIKIAMTLLAQLLKQLKI